MANYSAIKAAVNAYIKQNGRKEITGRILNAVLNATIDSLGRFFQFAGGATPSFDPGQPDQNVCYLATEPGLYTHFNNILIENEEVALLFWNGVWVKQRIAIGIQEVDADVDDQTGTPYVDVSYSEGRLVLHFHEIKGDKGDTGDPAGFGDVEANVLDGVGTPDVSVETSGDNAAKNIMFTFSNLKGEPGVTSVVATIDESSGTPSCQVTLENGVLTLAFSGLKGLKGDTGVSADYPITIYNGLDSNATDQALAAAQGAVLREMIRQTDQNVDIIYKDELGGAYLTSIPITNYGEIYTRNSPVETDAGGNPVVHSSAATRYVIQSCSPGDVFYIKGKGGASPRLWAFVDAEWNILSNASSNRVETNGKITAPANSVKLICNFTSGDPNPFLYGGKSFKDIIDERFNNLVQKNDSLTIDVANLEGYVRQDKAIAETGEEIDAVGYFSTIFIRVNPGDIVKYLGGFTAGSTGEANNYSLVAYRDDQSTKVSSWVASTSERELVMPANTAYIRATFKPTSTGNSLKINDVSIPIYGEISSIESEITELGLVDQSIQEEIVDINGVAIVGKGVTGLGALVDNPSLIATELIPARPGDVVDYLGGFSGSGSMNWSLVVYRADGTTRITNWAATTYNRTLTLPNNTAYIRATFKKGTNYSLSINGDPVTIVGTIDRKIVDFFDTNALTIGSVYNYVVAQNVFGDVLPPLFKGKFYPADKDILVACQGDSLTGLIERTAPQADPAHCPPGCQFKSWIYLVQERVGKIKPLYDRIDSQRNNADFFSKIGNWQNVVDIARTEIYDSDGTTYGQERSVSALTFQCEDNTAAVSFVFNADIYEKCNIVFSKEPDGVLTRVVIAEGDGKMLASLDRITWVEANGLQVTQRTFDNAGNDVTLYPSLNAFTNACAADGIATRERHRRIWMKKVDGLTGDVNISYQRDNSVSYPGGFMYVWGVERYSGNTIFFDNIGRGGRETDKLAGAITDVFDRNPDLCIFEMPLNNETDRTLETLKGGSYYGAYFLGSGNNSFKTRSNNYADVPILVVLPHGRSAFFDDSDNAISYSDQPSGQPVAYNFFKQMYGWLMGQMAEYENVKLINLYDQLINEIKAKGYTIKNGTQGADYAITADGVHLNDYGSLLWMAYLASLFQ